MKRLILLCLTLLLTVSFVISGVTLAFFSDQEFVGSSVFEMGSLSLTSVNTYSDLDDPHTYVKSPSWTVQNTGTMNLNLRVKVMCGWAQIIAVEVENEKLDDYVEQNEVVHETPSYVISLTNDLWTPEGNGWYVYQYPILPNEIIQVDAKITVIDPEWEGALEVYFEAEAQEVSSGGDYD